MSVVQAAFTKIIEDIRSWGKLNEEQKIDTFKSAYFLLGRTFLQAIMQIQKNPTSISVKEGEHIIIIEMQEKKEIIFYKKGKLPLQIQCTCDVAWGRKTHKNMNLVCICEVTYLLWKYCFSLPHCPPNLQPMASLQSLYEVLKRCTRQ